MWLFWFYFENRWNWYIVTWDLLDNPFHVPDDFEVDRESIQQFTWLIDKNGKEIYEGDIVNFWGAIHKIVFDRWCFYMEDSSEPETVPYILYIKYHHQMSSVIGNIYENPELLQNEK